MKIVKFNRWVDLADRAGWTFIQTFAGSIIAFGYGDWKTCLGAAGIAAFGAVLKTGAAQKIGNSPLGDAVPGASVVETEREPMGRGSGTTLSR